MKFVFLIIIVIVSMICSLGVRHHNNDTDMSAADDLSVTF